MPPPTTRTLQGGTRPAAVIWPVKKRPKCSAASITALQWAPTWEDSLIKPQLAAASEIAEGIVAIARGDVNAGAAETALIVRLLHHLPFST
jgi:hypothetical protein